MAGYIQVVLEGGVQDVGLIAPRPTMALKGMSAGKVSRGGDAHVMTFLVQDLGKWMQLSLIQVDDCMTLQRSRVPISLLMVVTNTRRRSSMAAGFH